MRGRGVREPDHAILAYLLFPFRPQTLKFQILNQDILPFPTLLQQTIWQ